MPAYAVSFLLALALVCESACAANDSNAYANGMKRTVLHALEKVPAAAHVELVKSFFQAAGHITLKYRRPERMGRALFEAQQIDEHWQYRVEYKCAYECLGIAKDLQVFFASGLRSDGACPAPIDLVVVFHAHATGALTKMFANSAANCFTLENQSFIVTNQEPGFLVGFLERPITDMF